MKITTLLHRHFHWINLPSAILMVLLQRTPVLNLLVRTEEMVLSSPISAVLQTAVSLAALGAVNSVAGATPLVPSAGTATALTVTVGTPVSVFYTVNGTATQPMSWTINGSIPPGLDFSGLTSPGTVNISTLHLEGTPTTSGVYTVTLKTWQFTDAGGVGSPLYTYGITVNASSTATAPAFTTQPASQTVTAGTSVTFTAAASGTPAPTYQWQKGGVAISGATSSSYTIASAASGDAGNYTVVATNSAGTATSAAATLTVNAATAAPAFTTQPASQTVTVGASVTFTAAASGNPAPTFQWQKGGVAISGATSSSYTIASAASGDAGDYTVVATNSAGTATSAAATLTVNAATAAPAFTTQPASQTVTVGASVTFTAAASGTPAPTYQWQKGGVAISGATSSSYMIASAASGDAGNYTVVATNSAGTATSTAATLTVNAATAAPAFTTQPASQSVTVGGSVTFTAAASGNPAPTYQWQKGGVAISGATSGSYTINSAASGDAGDYTVVATNSAGTATSATATLTVSAAAAAPAITTQPTNQTVASGGSVTFTAAASGNPTPTYQWQKGGVAISGATSSSYTISSVGTGDAGSYTVVATNASGSATSTAATLTVTTSAPTQVTSVMVTTGHSATFSAGHVTGSIQWQVSTNAGSSWTNLTNDTTYSGATSVMLTVANAGSALNNAQYRYQLTNAGVVATSNAATLTVAQAFFQYPNAIAIDSGGNLYVTDGTMNLVQKVNASAQVAVVAGTNGMVGSADGMGAAARFNQPGGIAVLSSGVLIVADSANDTLRSIAADGTVTTLAGKADARGSTDGAGPSALFSDPIGLALDSAGNIYVADAMNDTLRKVMPSGTTSTLAGSPGVTGTANGAGGTARFNFPTGVATDSAGNTYVADTTNNLIRKADTGGNVSALAGLAGVSGFDDGTGTAALFNHPGGLALDSAGNLYLADTGNSTIRKITAAGAVTTLAGTPGVAGLEDGTGTAALFNQPQGLAVDGSGNVFVADTGNAALRKVTPAGVVTTLALSAAPTPTPTPTPTPAPPPSMGGGGYGGGGGGGGAVSPWFTAALLLLSLIRRRRRPVA